MASRLFFNGHLYTTPTTVSAVNDTAMAPLSPSVGNTLAIIGQCTGGPPAAVLSFSSPQDAAANLVSGELLDAVTKAFAPSPQTGAPGTIKAVRVGNATRSGIILADAQGNQSITVVSRQYGPATNSVQIKVDRGSSVGLRVTTSQGNKYYVGDNLSDFLFSLSYAGTAAATLAISATTLTLTVGGATVAAISLASAATISGLVGQINGIANFSATVFPAGGPQAATRLDGLGVTPVSSTPLALSGTTAAVVDWLNSPASPLVGGIAQPGAQPPVPAALSSLAGGTASAPALSDWVAALEILQSEDVQWVVPLSGDPAVHAATDAHVQYMSTQGRRERRALVGPAAGTPIATAASLPQALNSDRTSVCWPGYFDYDPTGALSLYAPYMTAACVAAGFAGLSPGEAMTNKALSVRGLEATPRNPTDTDPLIQSGVLVIEQTTKGFYVVRSVSTWLINDNFNRVEVSCGAAVDYVVAQVRAALDPLRGGRGDPRQLARAITITETTLTGLAVSPPQGPGVIVGDKNSPAFRNITASLNGDQIAVSFECSPVIPTNFITATVSIVPYSGTASA